ncbi:MAG: DNA mismatch repair endonuclease MutL, partial [bacterium]|nr:DNA mismatch repair endonuclease MutL [bacterium]
MSAVPYPVGEPEARAPLNRQPIAAIPSEEVQKICAGEVVERPLSVVKELVENALDAGARAITVELEDGGRRLIRVSDDGGGIPAGELPLALQPHCTSKLRCLDDLMRLSTLGFRGEALSSIAAVSKVTLSSRFGGADIPVRDQMAGKNAHPTGHRIEVHAGALVSSAQCNLRGGTEVEVRELFYNVPARLKFLRSSASESAQVSGLLTTYALAYPEVRWTLTSGGRTLLQSDGDGDLHAVLADLLGSELAADLVPINFEYPPMAASGYISAPHRHWHNRTRQWFLVNRRPVNSKLLYKAVDDAMREFVTAGKFPAGVFMLDLPPEEIDVNVHPAKTEVAFAQPEAAYSLLLTAVRRALGEAAATRQRKLTQGMSLAVTPVVREFRKWGGSSGPPSGRGSEVPRHQPEALLEFAAAQLEPQLDVEPIQGEWAIPVYEMDRAFVAESKAAEVTIADATPTVHSDIEAGDPGEILQVMQVADTYLVLVTTSEVYLIDQHSAHERVLFEELWEKINSGTPTRQMLLLPQSIDLTPAEAGTAELLLPELQRLGFGAQLVGHTLEISEVPALLGAKITPELLASSISEMASVGGGQQHVTRLVAN